MPSLLLGTRSPRGSLFPDWDGMGGMHCPRQRSCKVSTNHRKPHVPSLCEPIIYFPRRAAACAKGQTQQLFWVPAACSRPRQLCEGEIKTTAAAGSPGAALATNYFTVGGTLAAVRERSLQLLGVLPEGGAVQMPGEGGRSRLPAAKRAKLRLDATHGRNGGRGGGWRGRERTQADAVRRLMVPSHFRYLWCVFVRSSK